jgi:manganese oxidase
MFWQSACFFALALSIILVLPTLTFSINIPAHGQSPASPVPQEEYDKLKNCTTNLSKKPTPVEYLTHFNCGHVSKDETGKTVRQFTLIIEENQKIPITYEGHIFDGWTFNGTIPGPTIRVTEGDLVRIRVINSNENTHAHSLYSQPTHYVNNEFMMTGQPGGTISPGRSFTYDFVAGPYGVYPYYCHVEPIADHINRGLYGMMIIDPKEPRPQMTEMAMLLNGYDLDLDLEGQITLPPVDSIEGVETSMPINSSSNNNTNEGTSMSNTSDVSFPSIEEDSDDGKTVSREKRVNEIYTVNGKAFDYMMNPIVLQTGEQYRVYIINMLEFDAVNSIHVHGAMFNYFSAGTNKTADYLTDIVTLTNGDRGIMEFTYDYPGSYMFHAHQTLFTDLGWMGLFDVRGTPVSNLPSDAT